MKIIHFIASIDKSAGGTTAYMQLLASELKKKLSIIIATGFSNNPEKIDDVKVVFFNTGLTRWFSMQKEFINFLQQENPNLVHINGIWDPENWLFQKAAQKLKIKVILSPHGMLEPYILNRHPLKKKIALTLYQHYAIRSAEFLHATAKSEYKNIKKLGYVQTLSIIPNGIDISKFPGYPSKKVRLPKKILFLSRIHPQKGIEYLVEAWSKLDSKLRKGWMIEVIGNGDKDYIKTLQKKINHYNLQKEIIIKSPVFGKEKIQIFREASLFVLPTYSENFGIVVAEALASYTPVITTKGTPWEELETEQCGWWIDLNTSNLVNILAEALETSDKKLAEMGLNGRKLVEKKYDIKAVAKEMNNLYDSIVNQG